MFELIVFIILNFSPFSSVGYSDCPPLKERLESKIYEPQYPVSWPNQKDNPSSFSEAARISHILFSPQPNGESQVAWIENGKNSIHLSSFDENLIHKGVDRTISGGSGLRDMVAHDDGAALLYFLNGRMTLHRVDANGKTLFKNNRLTRYSSRRIHLGSLAWNDPYYGVYVAVTNGGHEGDALSFIHKNGKTTKREWSWGCSHSIDQRLIISDGKFFALCLSEAYPGHGLFLNNRRRLRIAEILGGGGGFTNGRIGGFIELSENLSVAYMKRVNRLWEAHLTVFKKERNTDGSLQTIINGKIPNHVSNETALKIARLGENEILLSWADRNNNTSVWVYDSEAKTVLESGKELPMRTLPRSDLKTYPNGDVGWVAQAQDKKSLEVFKIKACKRENED